MKKRIICFAAVILLMAFTSNIVFAADAVDNNDSADKSESSEESTSDTDELDVLDSSELGPGTSLQLMFAKLQLAQAEASKQQAMDKMVYIQELQEEQKQVSAFLNTAREYQSEAKITEAETEMPADMAEYMRINNLSYDTTGDDLKMTDEEWNTAIASLEERLETLGMETQQQMVYVQDFMGQYNSYLQGANTEIANSNQTLTSLARGQSMYGDSEAGLAVTGLVVGLVLGCLITLAAQKLHRKKDKA